MIQWIYFEINLTKPGVKIWRMMNHPFFGGSQWVDPYPSDEKSIERTRHSKRTIGGSAHEINHLLHDAQLDEKCHLVSRGESGFEDQRKLVFAVCPDALENVFLTPSQLYFNWPHAGAVSNWTREKMCRLWVSRSRRPMILMIGVSTHDSQLSGTRVIFGGSSRLGTGSITIFITQWGKG